MTKPIFHRVVVPVANRDDAASTATALAPYVENTDCSVISVHVIEKTGGAPNKAPVAKLEQRAKDIFAIITEDFDTTGIPIETDLRYGTDIASSILDAAHDGNASAIVFTPRGGSRWRKLLTGDVTHNLVTNSGVPILVLPDREEQKANATRPQPSKKPLDR
ncbi:universal stress protein [Halorubrum amylolyticum]|uniref:universal stress protein n=1 Tax=Halorubrum amylolyticum TaxID=2508724 RepID=UPI0010091D9B